MLKNKRVIIVRKKGHKKPLKIFGKWWDAGDWCDKNLKKENGFDPVDYEIKNVKGFMKIWYLLFYKFEK